MKSIDQKQEERVVVFNKGTKEEHTNTFVHPYSDDIVVEESSTSSDTRLRVAVVGRDNQPIDSMQYTCAFGNASTTLHLSVSDARKTAEMLLKACKVIEKYNRARAK